MKKIILLLLVVFSLIFCTNNNQNEKTHSNQDSIQNPHTIEAAQVIVKQAGSDKYKLLIFNPINLKIRLKSKRPSFCEHNFLSVAAAFTSKTNTIDGIFIEKGQFISNTKLEVLNGTCILMNDSLVILNSNELTDSIINSLVESKSSLFQQVLLIHNSKLVSCSLFGQKKFVCRALIELDNRFCICQSKEALTIQDFQKALIDAGVKNAVYLDMGGWSEGWYKNAYDEKMVIGEGMTSTDRQTNWLVYEL